MSRGGEWAYKQQSPGPAGAGVRHDGHRDTTVTTQPAGLVTMPGIAPGLLLKSANAGSPSRIEKERKRKGMWWVGVSEEGEARLSGVALP